ncbi:MAG TPA: hypothetical protein VIK64_18155 [Anaerolineales bacterium]
MATAWKLYRTNRIGDGTRLNAYRSPFADLILDDGISGLLQWINDARPIYYEVAICEETIHTSVAGNPDIKGISPLFFSAALFQAWLDSTWEIALDLSAMTQIEVDGFSLSWLSPGNSCKDVIRYISKIHVAIQRLRRLRDEDSLDLFRSLLDNAVNTLSPVKRSKISSWMQSMGLDTSWITGSTKIRQVIHYIVENINWPILGWKNFNL